MTRPLFYKTSVELDQMVDRNASNRAELELVLAELKHRDTINARNVAAKAKLLIAKIEKREGLEKARVRGSKKREANASQALKLIRSFADRDWSDAPALEKYLARVLEYKSMEADDLADRISKRLRELQSGPAKAAPVRAEQKVSEDRKPMPSAKEQERRWTEEAVADLRKKLIDLSKRNPLIAFKHTSRGASHLRFVDERPDIMFEQVVEGSMGFEPLPDEEVTPKDEQTPDFQIACERARLTDEEFLAATETLGDQESDARAWQQAERALRARVRQELSLPAISYGKALDVKALAIAHGFDPSFDLKNSDDGDTQAHHEDDKLRVLLTRKELEKRLKTIWDRYRGHARETGLHTLFLVFGFVQWYEDETSDVALHAPLLLLPVQLERNLRYGRYEFRLRGSDEGLQVNVALVEKLRLLGLELPKLRENETPESFFIRTKGVLEKGVRLTLRSFATLAVLPFPRMVLWMDLDPANWPDGAFSDHALLPVLLHAKGTEGGVSMTETHDIDAPEWAKKAPPLIQPADASQHSALIDIVAGKSVAIEGPPGTGKSQTITNMIAAALDAGKRVLFVAEKQAALKVVADRLRHAGLGSLLLELHSDGADRTSIYDSLRERNADRRRVDENALAQARQQLAAQRNLIRRYLSLIETKLGALDRSAHWLAWREIALRSGIDRAVIDRAIGNWAPANAKQIDRIALADARDALTNFAASLDAINVAAGKGARTLWAEAERLGAFNQDAEIALARDAAAAAKRLQRAGEAIAEAIAVDFPGLEGAIAAVAEQLDELTSFGEIEEEIVRAALRDPEGARALLARQARWRQIRSRLDEDLADPTAVDEASTNRLSDAFNAHSSVPESVTALRERLGAVRSAIDSAAQSSGDRVDLLSRLQLADATRLSGLKRIAALLVQFEAAAPPTKALLQPILLDELAVLAVQAEQEGAEALVDERARLKERVLDAGFDWTPEEIERRADTIENSGIFSRVFGGAYRATKREAMRHLVAPISDRMELATLLRQLARHLRQVELFKRDSSAAALFPGPLWRGISSDWPSLAAAGGLLKSASESLEGSAEGSVLDRWLALPQRERSAICGLARTVMPTLEAVVDLGFGERTAADLNECLTVEEAALSAINDAISGISAKADGLIVREGEPLHLRLETLLAAHSDFSRLSESPDFKWVGDITDPLDPLARALSHCEQVGAIIGPLKILDALKSRKTPVADLDQAISLTGEYADAVAHWQTVAAKLEERVGIQVRQLVHSGTTWRDLSGVFRTMVEDERGARLAADLIRYRAGLTEIGCEKLAAAALAGQAPGAALPDLYELALVRELLRQYLGGDGAELSRLGGLTLESARKAFVRIDNELQELEARAIVAKRLCDAVPRGNDRGPRSEWSERALLDHELSLKRPRTPIRDVTSRAGKALQALKPVWMMSPTSAAQYIRPGSLHFDLLVVDEASQMRPEFAVSAIMRGSQFVVVGDANQLPPTDFFSASSDDDDNEDAGPDGEKMRVDTESILDLANERFQHRRRLKWHYRSQHEGLIQFSNRQFYGRDLVVFPSPTVDNELLGVKHVYVGGTYEASINEAEAKAVIEEAFRLMRAYPERSIGIATMNAKQTELIRNEFDRLILEAPEVRNYIDSHAGTIDEFFIKNLENVQGDERDIILISTVYGPNKDGVVRQHFGPMNREVGWRRLNVLVTRAKLSTRIFTSLRPDDVKVTPDSNKGVIALRGYLNYARNGAQYDEDAAGGEPDSDFEIFVADAVRAAGYEVVPQVGVEGFRIDLGIRHPDYPVGFVAGVECDGASYHSGMTVRDRDRIRQTVLEQMGWNIHRVWSTDWFADPARETAKLLARLDGWREDLAREYAARPTDSVERAVEAAPAEVADDVEIVEAPSKPPVPQIESEAAEEDVANEPSGRPMRPIDGIEWYEVRQGHLYDVWLSPNSGDQGGLADRIRAGTVEVLSRATGAARVYGDQLRVPKSEFEGWVERTEQRFIMHDIYAAVREVARRAAD